MMKSFTRRVVTHNIRRSALLLSLCLAASVGMTSAQARNSAAEAPRAQATQNAVTVQLTQMKVINDKGVEKRVEATSVAPNDVIEYRAVYKNVSTKPVTGLLATLPIPEGLEYIPKSAKPAREYTVAEKGGLYAAEPLTRPLASGKAEPVPYNEYRSVRWNLDQLAAGASVEVVARAKVEAVVPLVPQLGAAPGVAPKAPKP
ncbi:MAG: hypothetical protein QM639_09605 [Rhodocyclaceae bacterium]